MKTERSPALHVAAEFFHLPIARWNETGCTPLETRDQPTGFVDRWGDGWIAILTEAGLKRRRLE